MTNWIAVSEEYRRLRDGLLADFPELIDDDETLADTLEGLAQLPDVVAGYVRSALNDETLANALAERIKEMTERKSRLTARSGKRRAIAAALMNSVACKKIEQPDFTASLRFVPPKVIVPDVDTLPDRFCRITRAPDKRAISDAMQRGETVQGAVLGNGSITLAIRTS
jgi:hypothetical protein